MRKQIVTVALAGSLGLAGAALVPAVASAQTASPSPSSSALGDRLTALKEALAGLVTDKTLTQAQADRVATVLADRLPARGGRGGHGPHGGRVSPEATAEAAGATVAELQAAREAGQTLAQLAASNGVSKSTLVSRLVEAAEAQLAADVTAGRLTQAEADQVRATLQARITEKVDSVRGPGGRRGSRHDGGTPGTPSTPGTSSTPGSTASATPSVGA